MATAKDFCRVMLSLENTIYPEEKLRVTPSMLDGLDKVVETNLRIIGCEYIQTSGILLKLPQVAMATAQVLYHRYYYSKSFVKYNYEICAMACIFLAAKIEESPRRIRDVVNVFHHIRRKLNEQPDKPMDYMGNEYFTKKNEVIKAERRILKELGFCVHVKHPHKVIVTSLKLLECHDNTDLLQKAWNYMNDSLRTDVFMRYTPETIACACIYLSARQLGISLPSNPPWYEVFDATTAQVERIARTILHLYTIPKVAVEELEKEVDKVKKLLDEKRKKEKEDKQCSTLPPSVQDTPVDSPHNDTKGSPNKSKELVRQALNRIRENNKDRASNRDDRDRRRSDERVEKSKSTESTRSVSDDSSDTSYDSSPKRRSRSPVLKSRSSRPGSPSEDRHYNSSINSKLEKAREKAGITLFRKHSDYRRSRSRSRSRSPYRSRHRDSYRRDDRRRSRERDRDRRRRDYHSRR